MDSKDHPVVQRGIKVAELISDVSRNILPESNDNSSKSKNYKSKVILGFNETLIIIMFWSMTLLWQLYANKIKHTI